jgi:transmembrane sensor
MKPGPFQIQNEAEAERVAYLVAGYIRHTLTPAEHDELDAWITASDHNQALFEELTDPQHIDEGLQTLSAAYQTTETALADIKKRISFTNRRPAKAALRYWLYGIAASLLILAGAYFLYQYYRQPDAPAIVQNALEPGRNAATLTLANGRKIDLGQIADGIVDSASAAVKDSAGIISYAGTRPAEKSYHILHTPTGGQYHIVLPDGSEVWLNAASSLRYPTEFDDTVREVELEGEGYFEISSIATTSGKKPFIVKVHDGSEVRVLGTQFDINSYTDEPYSRTVLVEGKINLRKGLSSALLIPGDEARLEANTIRVSHNADINAAIAWKRGEFRFDDAPIEEIMRQVARWYGAEVVYKDSIDSRFTATIYRNEPVEKLLDVLATTKRVKFSVEGRRIVVGRE